MKTTMLMTVLCAATVAASAQEATPDTWMGEAMARASRAEVREQLAQARASGEMAQWNDRAYLPTVTRPRLRAEVIAQLYAARASGELARLHAEAHDFAPLPAATAYAGQPLLADRR
jgi:hypothetical protein